jgi:hypothetical protein
MGMRETLLAIALLVVAFSCKRQPTEPPPPPPPPPPYVRTIDLAVLDTGLTDAYLRVKFLDTVETRAFRLHRDGQAVLTVAAAPLDTVLLQDSLAPGQSYTYKAYRVNPQTPHLEPTDSSLSVSLTTLDSTSHEFTFQTFEFGEHSSSVFNDVAVTDANIIWIAGEVYLRDSLGQIDPDPYNVVRWDGTKWSFLRAMFPGVCNQPGTAPVMTRTVFAFAEDDVWISSAGIIARWNGAEFSFLCIPSEILPGSINRIWGQASNSVYIVGNVGTIVYWNGTSWQRIASGTSLHLYDIFGETNPVTGEEEVYAVAAELGVSPQRKILKVTPQGVLEMASTNIPSSLHGVWFKAGRRYWVVGAGMYAKTSIASSGAWQPLHPGLTQYYTGAVRGSNINDVAVCGSFGELLHFNGFSWKSYRTQVGTGFEYGRVVIRGGLIVAVGFNSSRAAVVIGRR